MLDSQLPEFGPLGLRQHFGAKGDGSTPDDQSIQEWWDAGVRLGRELKIEEGHYRCLKAIILNLSGCREDGIIVTGAGRRRSVFELAAVDNDVPFQIVCKRDNSDPCKDEYSAFDSEFSRFGIAARFNGPALQLGQNGCGGDQYPDALNSCYFEKLGTDNNADSHDNVAVKVNYVLQSIIDVKANCHGRPDKLNKGTALQLRHSAFNVFSGSYCNAHTCMEISGDDSSFSNFFHPVDFEEGTVAVRVTAEKSRNQTMMTPHLGTKHGFSCQAGEKFVVITPNDGLRIEDYNATGQQIGQSKGQLIVHGKGLEFVSLLNGDNYIMPSRVERRRAGTTLKVVGLK